MTESEWLDIFSKNLIEMMDNVGMSQRDLAKETSLDESTISRYINKERIPTVKAIINISVALCCDIDDLIFFGDYIV